MSTPTPVVIALETTDLDPVDDVLERAQAGYDAWYDAEPVPGEEDSLSHEYVRETVPDLLEALRASRAEVTALKALSSAPTEIPNESEPAS